MARSNLAKTSTVGFGPISLAMGVVLVETLGYLQKLVLLLGSISNISGRLGPLKYINVTLSPYHI
jgi:hypothetical protein